MDNLGNTPLLGAGSDMSVLPPMVTASFDGESEDALAMRYGRAKKKNLELTYEFTRDAALLHQYTSIYEEEFRVVQNALGYSHHEDEHDRRSHFLIVRQGNLCVGGARLTVKTPRQPHLLPMEMDGFRIEEHFPDLRHREVGYGQIGRVCLLPEFRGGEVTRMMFWHLHRKTVVLGLEMMFATAPIFNARVNRKLCISLGIKDTAIYPSITIPPYPGCEEVKMYLMRFVANKSLVKHEEIGSEEHVLLDDKILANSIS